MKNLYSAVSSNKQRLTCLLMSCIITLVPLNCNASAKSKAKEPATSPHPTKPEELLKLSWEEVSTRLPAFTFSARSAFTFKRLEGGKTREFTEKDTYFIRQDRARNLHVLLTTPSKQVETYLAPENFYIREDRGLLRRKTKDPLQNHIWPRLAFNSLQDVLKLIGDNLQFKRLKNPLTKSVPARTQHYYQISYNKNAPTKTSANEDPASLEMSSEDGNFLENTANAEEAPPDAELKTQGALLEDHILPVATQSRFKSFSELADVQGELWLDPTQGVVTLLKLVARWKIDDHNLSPTDLLLRYEAQMSDLESTELLVIPASVPEFNYAPLSAEPLNFFRPLKGLTDAAPNHDADD